MEGIIEQAEFITQIYSHCWFVSVFRQVGTLLVIQSLQSYGSNEGIGSHGAIY